MIYDRVIEDVTQAQALFENKVKKFIPLTDAEKTTLERGRVTVNTLNRIEQKQAEIGQILKDWKYLKEDITNKQWSNEVFFREDLQRLTDNTAKLRDAFYVLSKDLPNPEARYYFEEFNIMERFLFEIEELIKEAKSNFKRSGAISANQKITLPLKGDAL